MKTIHMHRTVRVLAATAPVLLAGALATAGPAAAATAGAPATAAAFPHFDHRLHADSFWAGYADTGTAKFTSISGSWTVPKLDCATTKNSSVSPWLGLDGWSSDTVEQIGFDQDCQSGVAGYHPWVEMYPANSIYFTETLKPGDVVTASVSVSGTTFTLSESDTTQGWTKTYTKTGNDRLSSAEAILEDLGSGIGQVADFGTIPFTGLTSNGKPLATAGTPNSTNLERGSTLLTKNSALTGGAFTITWLHA
ncbi:MAG TPA: G1 family glutamic endopeptidase [Actinocrinis sp.]|nr:G1 family glutamic endopeptidase [Actinocrinis sp.]